MITFTLSGEPVPKGRARFGVINGNISGLTPAKTRAYEKALGYAARIAMMQDIKQMALGDVVLTVEAVLPIPQSWTKAKREAAQEGLKRPTGRPDVDNYAKIVMDALNGIAWKDDSQVVELRATKRYGETPYLKVTVE